LRARNKIGAIGAWEGNSQITLADIFDVAVDGSADAAGTKIIIIEAMTAGEIIVKGNVRLLAGVLNWGGTIVIEGDTTLPGGEMKSGTTFVKGKVLEMLPSYKDEGTEEVDGVTYRKYTGDLSRNGEGVLYVSV
jgi:formylmethanofuran dehydrogenase subunit C